MTRASVSTARSPWLGTLQLLIFLFMAFACRHESNANPTATESPAQRGQAFFLLHCASCHGEHGRGTALVAASKPPDFQDRGWQSSRTDQQILDVIVHGKPGTPMIGWPMLSDQERTDLVAFIRSLNVSATPHPSQ